ncbi:glycosyltransferase, partial [Streptomyces sp. NPDC054840]
PGDVRALATATAELLADDTARRAYGEAGRRRVLSRYGWSQVAAATERSYRSVLAGRLVVAGTTTS